LVEPGKEGTWEDEKIGKRGKIGRQMTDDR
jgi:hypothetical protein